MRERIQIAFIREVSRSYWFIYPQRDDLVRVEIEHLDAIKKRVEKEI